MSNLHFPFSLFLIFMVGATATGQEVSMPPYPRSPVITSLRWDGGIYKLKTKAGDNWPITWAEEDMQITAWGDGPGFDEQPPRLSLGFARVWGDPPNLRAEDFASSADILEGGGSSAIKASGLLVVNRMLYMWVRNYKPPGTDDFTNARLACSKDYGTNWTWSDWHFADTFGCPEFVQFGPGYRGARDRYVMWLHKPTIAPMVTRGTLCWPECLKAGSHNGIVTSFLLA